MAKRFSLLRNRSGGSLVGAGVFITMVIFTPIVFSSNYLIGIGTIALAMMILAVGFNLVYGFMGYLSLGQVAFWAVGAYSAALLSTRLGVTPLLASLLACLIAAALAFLVGLPAFRLNRHSFAIATLTVGLLIQLLATDWVDLTRGPLGIPSLPTPTLDLGFTHVEFGSALSDYYLIGTIAIVLVLVMYRLGRSRIGATLRAIKENEPLAESQGVNTLKYKLLVFTVAGAFSGLAGSLLVFHVTLVDPSIADFYYTEAVLIMVIIAGKGSFWPVVASSIIFTFVPELLQIGQEYRLIIYGAILILAALAFPAGIVGLLRARRLRELRRQYTPALRAASGGLRDG